MVTAVSVVTNKGYLSWKVWPSTALVVAAEPGVFEGDHVTFGPVLVATKTGILSETLMFFSP